MLKMDKISGFFKKSLMSEKKNEKNFPARKISSRKLTLETLENRELLATYNVIYTTDSGLSYTPLKGGELRGAIEYAKDGDTIVFSDTVFASGGTINLQNGLTISKNLTIQNTTGQTISLNGSTISNSGRILTIGSTSTSCSVSIEGVDFINGKGGGIKINNANSVVNMTDCTVSGNSIAGTGGGITNAGTLSLNNCIIQNNTVTFGFNGGGIYTSGAVTSVDSSIINNTTTGYGGGVYVYYDGSFSLTNGTVQGNHADEHGGGFHSYETVTVSNSKILGNSANGNGGGFSNYGTNGTLIVSDSEILGNSALGSGGAFYADSESSAVSFINCTIADNIAGTQGGAGYIGARTATIIGTTVARNTTLSQTETGGFFVNSGRTLNLVNSIVSGNRNAIAASDIAYSGKLNLFYSTIGSIQETTISLNNVSSTVDEPISTTFWNIGNDDMPILDNRTHTFAVRPDSSAATGGTLTGKSADNYFYYNKNLNLWVQVDNAANTIAFDSTDTNNYGLGVGTPNPTVVYKQAKNGSRMADTELTDFSAGSYTIGFAETPPLVENSLVVNSLIDLIDPTDNVITLREAIEIYAQDGDTISFNPIDIIAGSEFMLSQGQILIDKSITITAANLYANNTPGVTINAGQGTTSADGRIFSITNPELVAVVTIEGIKFTGGNATGSGGAVYNTETVTFRDCSFDSNYSDGNGGAIANVGGTVNVLSTANGKFEFKYNSSFNNGGAISNVDGTVIIDNTASASASAFTNNIAYNGGAIYNFSSNGTADGATVSLTGKNGASISMANNNAENSGGAMANRAGTINALYTDFTENSSHYGYMSEELRPEGYGGAFYNLGTAEITNANFTKNEAVFSNGGAICNGSTGILSLKNVAIGDSLFPIGDGNKAQYGGGIINGNLLTMDEVTMGGNTAEKNGGAISNTSKCTLDGSGNEVWTFGTINIVGKDTFVLSNTSTTGFGGGLYSGENTFLTIADGVTLYVLDNSATEHSYSNDVCVYRVADSWPTELLPTASAAALPTNAAAPLASGKLRTEYLLDVSTMSSTIIPGSQQSSVLTILNGSALVLKNLKDDPILYTYTFEKDGEKVELTATELLSADAFGLPAGLYKGTVTLSDENGTVCGTSAITLQVLETSPTLNVELKTAEYSPFLQMETTVINNPEAVSEWTVDWGDGTVSTYNTGIAESFNGNHYYKKSGDYDLGIIINGIKWNVGVHSVLYPQALSDGSLDSASEPTLSSALPNAFLSVAANLEQFNLPILGQNQTGLNESEINAVFSQWNKPTALAVPIAGNTVLSGSLPKADARIKGQIEIDETDFDNEELFDWNWEIINSDSFSDHDVLSNQEDIFDDAFFDELSQTLS